jgi:hypothetical protein
LCTRSVPGTRAILLEPQEWVSGLERERILNLLEILHFGVSTKINACVKVFLSCVHGGTLWLDPLVSINTILIVHITRLPKEANI